MKKNEISIDKFKKVNYVLGKTCKFNHVLEGTDKSPRYVNGGSCIECDRERKRKKRKSILHRTNSTLIAGFEPGKQDKKKYKEANENEKWIPLNGKIGKIDFDKILLEKGRAYQASTWGRVRYKTDRLNDFYYIKGYSNSGYKFTRIFGNSTGIHRIICHAFHPRQDENDIVLHKDDNKIANFPSNLTWGNHSLNSADMHKNNRYGTRPIVEIVLSEEEIKEEIWKKIPNTKNSFISSFGRIKKNEKFATLRENADGYVVCNIRFITSSGKTKSAPKTVHSIIGDVFLGRKSKYQHIRHLDSNKKNNKLENLALGTAHENAQDRLLNNNNYFNKSTKGPNNSNAKFSEEEEEEIKDRIKLGETILSIANKYKVSDSTIRRIKRAKING